MAVVGRPDGGAPRKATTSVRAVRIGGEGRAVAGRASEGLVGEGRAGEGRAGEGLAGVVGRAGQRQRFETVVTEEPLQIMAGGPGQESVPVAVTMRTPGNDFELAVGFLWGEGILRQPAHVRQVKYCEVPPDEPQRYNVVTVRTSFPVSVVARPFTTSAACGICGAATLDEVERACEPLAGDDGVRVCAETLVGLPDTLRAAQRVFSATGGLHAAGLFNGDGALVVIREDIGRHNAVDKAVGWAVLGGRVPLCDSVLVVSGRVSFEIVQKAAMAGVPVIAAVSAPSSLAIEAAQRLGVTLAAFVRDGAANLYSHPNRVQ